MNRNTESHFAQLPAVDIQRSVLDMSHGVKTSFNAARLIPFDWFEVLPGDTFKVQSSKVIRSQTMLTPILDNLYLDTYWFYVPTRLVWDHFEEFMGANKTSAWVPQVTYEVPSISSPLDSNNDPTNFEINTIADYMGYPTYYTNANNQKVPVTWTNSDPLRPSALPIRCYAKICEDWFRAETVTDPLNIPTGDTNQTGTNGDSYINDVANGGMPFKVAKYHDYFTSCLPSPLRANQEVSVNTNMPSLKVVTGDIHELEGAAKAFMFSVQEPNTNFKHTYFNAPNPNASHVSNPQIIGYSSDGVPTYTANKVVPINLWTEPKDLGFSVNDLRLAFQLQKFYEKAARAGSGRYIEIIKAHFGVTSPDARLQRSEYLGGNRIPIAIHEVTNSAQSENDFLGDLGAKSVTSDVHFDFEHSFTEHGYVIGVLCVRYDHTYPQGMRKALMRRKFEQFYWPEFANIGEQPVYDAEIFADTAAIANDTVFGYQEAYADYRFSVSTATAEMRPGVANTLASWHLADYYTSKPTLSDAWMREDETIVDRTLAVASTTANQFWSDIYLTKIATRPMPVYSIPGLIDHH